MAPFVNSRLFKIFAVKGSDVVTPAGVVSLGADVFLSDVRSACTDPTRRFIDDGDLFLLPTSPSLAAFCPIAHADEPRIPLNDYIIATQV